MYWWFWAEGLFNEVYAPDPPLNPHLLFCVKSSLLLKTNWNYNGVITVQTYKNGVSRPLRIQSQGCLRTSENLFLWPVPDPRTGLSLFRKHLTSCILIFSRSAIVTVQPFWTPANDYFNRNPYLPAPTVILDKHFCNFVNFALISLHIFVVQQSVTQLFLESLSLGLQS